MVSSLHSVNRYREMLRLIGYRTSIIYGPTRLMDHNISHRFHVHCYSSKPRNNGKDIQNRTALMLTSKRKSDGDPPTSTPDSRNAIDGGIPSSGASDGTDGSGRTDDASSSKASSSHDIPRRIVVKPSPSSQFPSKNAPNYIKPCDKERVGVFKRRFPLQHESKSKN